MKPFLSLALVSATLACGSSPDAGSGPVPPDGGNVRADGGGSNDGPDAAADTSPGYDAAPPDFDSGSDGAASNVNVMFVTSKAYSPNLGGLAGADKVCSKVAAGAGMPGTFVAWLSSSTTDAISRLGSARGWVRTDGLPFADTQADLAAGKVLYPPEYDEFGEPVVAPYAITMTGTHGDGSRAAGATCNDWTSAALSDPSWSGSGWGGGRSWTDWWRGGPDPTEPCAGTYQLYCFQTDHQTPVKATPPSGSRTAFVSTTLVAATGGLAAGDAACNDDAAAAGLSGTYKALMGTSTIAPESRLNMKGSPWARVDGVVVTPECTSSTLSIRADGSSYDHDAWVGAPDDPTSLGSVSCNDWTSTSPSDQGVAGLAGFSLFYLFADFACSDPPKPVFCFQD